MNDPYKDIQGFASQYLDLWQQQVSGESSERMVNDAMKTAQAFNDEAVNAMKNFDTPDKVQNWVNTWTKTWKEQMGDETPFPFPFTPEAFGAQAHSHASGDAERHVDELEGRITTLEERIKELESELKAKG